MQLDQNLFRTGSTGSLLFASESRFGGAGFEGGFDINTISQCGGGAARPKRRRRKARNQASAPDSTASDCARLRACRRFGPGWTTP